MAKNNSTKPTNWGKIILWLLVVAALVFAYIKRQVLMALWYKWFYKQNQANKQSGPIYPDEEQVNVFVKGEWQSGGTSTGGRPVLPIVQVNTNRPVFPPPSQVGR
jgi:hypothetical protein